MKRSPPEARTTHSGPDPVDKCFLRVHPDAMALLMTGDVSAQLETQAREVGVRVMHKPVRPKALQRGLLDLLETARRSAAEIAQGSPMHG